MAFEIVGKLIEKYDQQQVSDKFKKREFVIEKEEMVGTSTFTDQIKFQLTQDRCNLIETYNIGDTIKVAFNIRGRKWEKDGKVSYFTNLEGWKIENAGQGSSSAPAIDNAPPVGMDDAPSEDDDLPF